MNKITDQKIEKKTGPTNSVDLWRYLPHVAFFALIGVCMLLVIALVASGGQCGDTYNIAGDFMQAWVIFD